MPLPQEKNISLFYSYSHIDEGLRDKLEEHLSLLKRQGFISQWHDRRIVAGAEIDKAIDVNLNSADYPSFSQFFFYGF